MRKLNNGEFKENVAYERNGRFLTSNTNITVNKQTVPIGKQFIKFKTRQCVSSAYSSRQRSESHSSGHTLQL
jgi:hypothetical protein